MSSYANVPKQSYFSAVLDTPIDAVQTTNIILSAVPSYTPSGETVYLNILDPDHPETITVTGWNSSTLTLTGVTRGVTTYTGGSSSAASHAAGVLVVLSDDWHIFEDIQTAINSKVDRTGDTMTGPLSFSGTTNKGITVSVLTTVQRDALASPSNGLVIYNTTTGTLQFYSGGAWYDVGTSTPTPNGSTSVKGVYQTATVAEQLAATATGSTGAQLVPVTANMKTVSAGAGDAGKIVVLGATGVLDPTALNATATPTASKIPIASAGPGYLNTWVDPSAFTGLPPRLQKSFTAGENITLGNAVIMGNGVEYTIGRSIKTGSGHSVPLSTTTWLAQNFTSPVTAKQITTVYLGLNSALRTFTFGTPVPISPSTNYWVVLKYSAPNMVLSIQGDTAGKPNNTDIGGFTVSVNVGTNNGATADGTATGGIGTNCNTTTDSGATWGSELHNELGDSVNAFGDANFMMSIVDLDSTAGLIYKSNATNNNEFANNFIGFATANILASASGTVNVTGVDNNQTGLTTGLPYYLSDTSGAISTSAGTQSRKTGLSLSATEILIKFDNP